MREPASAVCAGRTDAGVHASGQVVSVTTTSVFPFERLALALNSLLPRDISVRQTAIVDDGFSARFSALRRHYVYAILNRPQPSALLCRHASHVRLPLDLAAMRTAAAAIAGEHDFRSFCGVPPVGGVTVRTVHALTVERCGELVRVDIAADGFLHRMVRTIVGTLVECGSGRFQPQDDRGPHRRPRPDRGSADCAGPGSLFGRRPVSPTATIPTLTRPSSEAAARSGSGRTRAEAAGYQFQRLSSIHSSA